MAISKDIEFAKKFFAPYQESERFEKKDIISMLSKYREELQKSIVPKDVQNAIYNRVVFMTDYARNDAKDWDDAVNKAYSLLLDFFCDYIFNKE